MKRLSIVAGLVAAMLLGVGIAAASIPGPDGVIHGCYKNSNGDLIVIDHAASCPAAHTALNWNQTGPSSLAVTTVESDVVTVQTEATAQGTALCPTGSVVTGGGPSPNFTNFLTDLTQVYSGPTNDGTSWTVAARNSSQVTSRQFYVHAICVVGTHAGA